jgi:signal transduction histidine kinase/DNA-binding response OmpR family regulator/streptogramin lyase
VVSGLTEDNEGNLWIGTEGGGLNFLDRKTNQFKFYKANALNQFSITANNIKSVIKDRKNTLWIGIHDGGVNYLDLNRKPYQFKSIDFPKSSEFSLKGLKVLHLLEDVNGNIWIGTLTGGVIVYNTKTKKLTKLDKDIRTIMCIAQSRVPNILIIGGDNGIEEVDINSLQKTKIDLLGKGSLIESPYVNSIFIDNFNNYWVGTEGQGLYKYNPNRKESKNFGLDEGIPSDIIYGILSDNNGNLWISSNYGITRFNSASEAIKNFTYSDGLQGNEFNYGSYFKTKNNELFLGGINGLTYFNPSDIQKNTYIPKVDIHNINVNNAPYLKITDSISDITLNYNQNDFSINFSVLSYMQSEKNQYAYKLEGLDEEWNYINANKATFTNLKSGNYTFKIKASNNDGVWNTEGASINIYIKPPFWKTWWAYSIYALIFIGLIVYVRSSILLRIAQKKELENERIERERIEETNKLKLKLFTDVSHEFRTPLTLITGPLERMISKNVGDKFIQEQHHIMNKNAKILLQLINQILDFRKNESGKIFLQASKSNIVPFIKDVKESFKALAQDKNVNYQFNTSKKKIEVWFDQIKLKKILFNLISNAFKFTKDNNDLVVNIHTTSKVENNKEVEYVVIEIINFVSVIPESHIKLIFDRFYQLDRNNMNMGSGIGLSLTKSLVELHKGFIEVDSSKEQGTCFSVYLRLGKDHLTEEDILLEPENITNQNFLNDLTDSQNSLLQIDKSDMLPVKENQKTLETILIVEDSIDVQDFIKSIFIQKYNVITANDGKQGYEKALKNKIDLIISDVSMPEMDGFELCEKIKTTLITSHIPVILLTARTSQTHKERGYSNGANTYITKPFNPNILETRVDNLLKTRASLIKKFKKDIVLNPKELTITSTDEIFLQKAIKVVEKNITNPNFNTNMFIDLMNMSRTVLYTKLKALTGQNLSTFIRVLKLKRAGQLIIKTDMNISQIAYDVGFNDIKYFRKCFKDFFNELPSKYRTNHKEQVL